MPSVLSLDLLILQEPAHCCIHDRRVVPQADDLRRTPPHMHDTDTAKARRIPCGRWITLSHPVHSSTRLPSLPANRSRPSQGLEADLHQDVIEGERLEAWGPGRRSTYLVSRTVRLLECTLKTHLDRGGYLRTALKIAVSRYMPMRWPVPPHTTEVSHRLTPCPLPSAPTGLGYELPLPAWCKILEGAHRSSLYGLLITHPVKMCPFPGTLSSVLSLTRGNHSHRNSSSGIVGNHSAMLTVNRAPSVPIYPVAHARSVSGG